MFITLIICLLTFLFIVAFLAVYFLPSIVAYKRLHHNRLAILIFNIFLGWTFLGWVGSLVWACTLVKNKPIIISQKL